MFKKDPIGGVSKGVSPHGLIIINDKSGIKTSVIYLSSKNKISEETNKISEEILSYYTSKLVSSISLLKVFIFQIIIFKRGYLQETHFHITLLESISSDNYFSTEDTYKRHIKTNKCHMSSYYTSKLVSYVSLFKKIKLVKRHFHITLLESISSS
jgi:hypothetical protein